MSKSSAAAAAAAAAAASSTVRPEDYANSPVHYAIAIGDHAALNKILDTLPKLGDPNRILTESESLAQEHVAEQISAVLDSRDNGLRETPMHLAVRLNDAVAVRSLAAAGANLSFKNAAGWNPIQEALLSRCREVVAPLVQHQHLTAWSKWRRRRPRLVAVLRRMRDFYMEMSFHFESSIVPFVERILPSDTYKIWKRDGNLRADTSLAGYDGLKIQRTDQSFLFLNDLDPGNIGGVDVPEGSLLILKHEKKKIYDAFENAGKPLSDSQISSYCKQTSVVRPRLDVTNAELVGCTNWRRQEKIETVGEWKARVYEMQNVTFFYRSRKANSADNKEDPFSSTCVLPLEIDEESDEGFIVAENPRFSVCSDRHRRHSSFVPEEREFVSVSRKSVDIIPNDSRRRKPPDRLPLPPPIKDKEYVKTLQPTVWLTEQFPLQTEELLPLLDILASKVKAVRRMREVLTTTFPPGTFPVKVAIPVIATVRVVITFTKFEELPPVDKFYTPVSSPTQITNCRDREQEKSTGGFSSWLRGGSRRHRGNDGDVNGNGNGNGDSHQADPFAVPSGYRWGSFAEKNKGTKKSKSKRGNRN